MSIINKIIEKAMLIRQRSAGMLAQDENARRGGEKIITPGMAEILRETAAGGAVLLENKILPLAKDASVSIFGRTQVDYFYTGYGSGGDVNFPYEINLLEGLRNCEDINVNEGLAKIYEAWTNANSVSHGTWGRWPYSYPEMPIDVSQVKQAAGDSDHAVVVIGRSSGEDRENVLEKGSFYITDEELALLRAVTANFDNTIVLLNIGCLMDMSWVAEFKDKLGALMIVWQGGMESGNAVADLLSGKVTPSGRLTSTIANKYEDYPSAKNFGGKDANTYCEDIYVGYRWFETFAPEKVLYPFGYGLSYTDFEVKLQKVKVTDDDFEFTIDVKNIGKAAGKNVAGIYLEKPCGKLGNPSRELVAFGKTGELAPGKSEMLELAIDKKLFASYDADGTTGNRSCYVIEAGNYCFYLGGDVKSAVKVHEVTIAGDLVTEKLSEACAPAVKFNITTAAEEDGKRIAQSKPVPTISNKGALKKKILNNLPKDIPMSADKGITLVDVKNEKASLDDFVAQLNLDELEALSRGDFVMDSVLGTKGNAAVYGGVMQSLRDKGIPAITTSDGPSGLRLFASCSLMPIGTLLASSFDQELVAKVYNAIGEEANDRGSSVLLAPGLNIHRNPLCGRNFEYYSEDPFVSGMIAAAAVNGLQATGVSACPKHFACNNQEYNRTKTDSQLSERALREIYLKGFELCIKKAKPMNIMTSYNKINGVWGHYHYELCTSILREEWGYEGCVMTDWWMQHSKSPEFPTLKDSAYRVRAQVDVLMPGGWHFKKSKSDGTLLATYGKPDGITLGEMQRSAKHVLEFAMQSTAFDNK